MTTRDLLPTLSNTDEVFSDVITAQGKRGLFRRRSRTNRRGFPDGVQSDFLATFHARIIAVAVNGDDPDDEAQHVYTVAVKSKYGSKLIEMPSRAFDGSANGNKIFSKRLYSSGLTGVAYPGRLAATIRAVVSLTREGIPMP